MYKCYTLNNIESGSKLAKIMTIKKNFLGNKDTHENVIVFRIAQSNNYNGYVEQQYMVGSVYNYSNQQTTSIFKELGNKTFNSFYCMKEETNEEINIYVKGALEYVPVRVFVDYCPNEGKINFITKSGFTYESTGKSKATNDNLPTTFTPIFDNKWSLNNDYYNIFKIENKNVTVRAILNSGNVGNGTKIFNIPITLSKPIYTFATFLSSKDNKICTCRLAVLTNGDVVVNDMNNLSSLRFEVNLNFSY